MSKNNSNDSNVGNTSTEDEILKINGITGDEGGEEENDDNTGGEGGEEEGSSRSEPDLTGAGKGGTGDRKGQPGKDTKTKGAGGAPLVDPKTGQVLAQPGAERRVFEQTRRKLEQYEKVEKPQYEARIKAYEQAAAYKEYGLSPEQAVNAYKLLKSYSEKPAETLKWLLTQAQANGIKIDLGGGGGLDPAAIKQMIAEQMAPITKAAETREQEQKLRDEAQQEYDSFMSRYPDAAPHEDAIAALISKDPSLTLDGAYWRLRAFFEQRKLDFTKPLAAHHAAMKQQGGKGEVKSRVPFMPTGRGHMGGQSGDNMNERSEAELAPVNADYSDIIRSAMKERLGRQR